MCLAVPAKLIVRELAEAIVDMHGNCVRVSTALVPDAEAGDWVLIHAGFAIQKIDETEAAETWALLNEALAAGGDE